LLAAPDVFTEQESAQLCAKTNGDRIYHFYRLWTLKEAFAKAVGKGLSLPLRYVGFDLNPFRLHVDQQLYQCTAEWHSRLLEPTSRHCLAVAARETSRKHLDFTWTIVDYDDLAILLSAAPI
jgi:4'-phosphopantetheinyl transferase